MKSSHMVTPILYMSVLVLFGKVGTSNLSEGVYCGLSRPTESEASSKRAAPRSPSWLSSLL